MESNMMNCPYNAVCTQTCSSACIRYLEIRALLDSSNIPKNRQCAVTLTPDDCDYDTFCTLADIKDGISQFISDGNNLYIVSKNTGNGKTTWAIKLMLRYFDDIWPGNGLKPRGLFIHVPTFLLKCKDFNNVDSKFEELKSRILTSDIVVWDDIGSTGVTNYDMSQLLMYIDQRILSGHSNIYTGNLMFDDLNKLLGSRLASRIWNTSAIAELRGKDKR